MCIQLLPCNAPLALPEPRLTCQESSLLLGTLAGHEVLPVVLLALGHHVHVREADLALVALQQFLFASLGLLIVCLFDLQPLQYAWHRMRGRAGPGTQEGMIL